MGNRARRLALRASIMSAISVVALLLSLNVAAADGLQPKAITNDAKDMHDLFLLVLALAIVVWILVTGALAYILIRFKKRNDELPPQIHGNNVLEVIWTAIPIIIVVTLFVFSFIVLINVDDNASDQDAYCKPQGDSPNDCVLTVAVTGFQFSWQFDYNLQDLGASWTPRDGAIQIIGSEAKIPEVVVPVNEPVEFTLHSNDVIHSFFFRNGLYKLDVVPGRNNKFVTTFETTGTFEGQCAELCGLNHARMRFSLRVVTRQEFDDWVNQNAKSAPEQAAAQPR